MSSSFTNSKVPLFETFYRIIDKRKAENQRRDSGDSGNHSIQSLASSSSSSSGRVLPGAKTSTQNGNGAIAVPPDSNANTHHRSSNSPQPSQVNSASSPASQRGSSSPNDSNVTAGSATHLSRQDVGRWSHAVQGADMPEEVKAIVRTGRHTWSRGITQKTTAPAASG
ncbi:hypothetical protein AGABI2DRAFT_120093 [Agaricus bisporus var. bisporus H97]|uniref:hypothetical protein n=1 Tax=Agaricus bisporus var. bisporus (strain H97 / ATCC MYA-4626 / FGSC 10389) TaxID=936046 RepID=UPI00029F6F04|nr:hypothetical protein AGABI2DRAFT_120093 [Agaricus bisporus var. bisporus H97]EKV45127.1 hypothetical protein AGABI2DRAFT_120093 [Agaricus bisporus var. bisporus H97]